MLYEHQKEAIRAIIKNPRYALYHEQGLGKTITSIIAADFCLKTNHNYQITVICPAFLQKNWQNEIVTWSKFASCYRIFSYEKFCNLDERTMTCDFLIIDEAHYIKNRRAKRTQCVVNASLRASRTLLLTGTPIGNSNIIDVYTHLLSLNPKNPWAQYRNFMCTFIEQKRHKFDKPQVVLAKVPEFMAELAKVSERRTKADCLDLPEKIYQIIPCQGSRAPTQLHVSHKMQLQEGFQVQVVPKNDAGEPCGLPEKYTSTSKKLYTLIDIINCIPDNEQIVVYVAFVKTLEFIQGMLKKIKVTSKCFSGQLSDKDKQETLEQFKQNKFRVLIATMQSLNVGVTLTNCHNVIYYSRTFSITERTQSEDRFHRIGQRNVVNYTDIIADGIDKRAYEMLKQNKTFDEIVEDLKYF